MSDRDIVAAVITALGLVIADGTRWTVVMDGDDRLVAAIAPGGTSVTTNLVTADALVPLAALIESDALADAPADMVVVVTGGRSVLGVWAATTSPTRSCTAPPGTPAPPCPATSGCPAGSSSRTSCGTAAIPRKTARARLSSWCRKNRILCRSARPSRG